MSLLLIELTIFTVQLVVQYGCIIVLHFLIFHCHFVIVLDRFLIRHYLSVGVRHLVLTQDWKVLVAHELVSRVLWLLMLILLLWRIGGAEKLGFRSLPNIRNHYYVAGGLVVLMLV
jgi:hypothetical protein